MTGVLASLGASLAAGSAGSPIAEGPDAERPFEIGTASERFLERVPREFARLHLVMSVGTEGEDREGVLCERLLVSGRTPRHIIGNVGTRLGSPVRWAVADDEDVASRIDLAYEARGLAHAGAGQDDGTEQVRSDPGRAGEDVERLLAEADRDVLSTAGKGPIVRLVDAMLFDALGRGASDVHVQPLAGRVLVRYRVDGVLRTARVLPRHVAEAVTGRIKVMGRMDVAERRVPQDGRAGLTIGSGASSRGVDLRISSLPTSHGERVVIRLLDAGRGRELTTLEALGMPPVVRERYLEIASRPQGVVLLTGPTGSGKTTTLYATLRWTCSRGSGSGRPDADGDLNIMTIEDPIEYELSAIGVSVSQAQVNTRKGVTFASGLRHILRQDPDVIMVGEIRDEETARIAVQASLTGHLVLSTLHTNSALGAIDRLMDLGIEPFLIANSLSGTMAQRLARRVHASCAGRGCDACMETGFSGRIGLFELLRVSPEIRLLIGTRCDRARLIDTARREGLRTLREEGMRLARTGITTEQEVLRVTLAEDEA